MTSEESIMLERSDRHRRRRAHAHGRFQGDFASLAASDLGAVAIKAAVERAGLKARTTSRKSILGNVLPAGPGPGAGAPGGAEGAGLAERCRLHDGQQDVRLCDEGRDARLTT